MSAKVIKNVKQCLLILYLGIMLGIFPLLYRYQYQSMGAYKYQIFLKITSFFILGWIFLLVVQEMFCKSQIKPNKKLKWTNIEKAVGIYLACNVISAVLSHYKKQAFYGSEGWYMGLYTLILLTGSFYILSLRTVNSDRRAVFPFNKRDGVERFGLCCILISSFLVFLLGVLHRFNLDPLQIYGDIPTKYKTEFLSTMGQASWYSSFLCVSWPIGLYFFYQERKRRFRILYGTYTVVGAMSLVSQNTDTAFLSLGAILIFLFYMCQKDRNGIIRFLECVLLIAVSFMGIGILQRIFVERMIPIEDLSLYLSQGKVTVVLFFITLFLYLLFKNVDRIKLNFLNKKVIQFERLLCNRKFFYIVISVVVLILVMMVVFIVLNSTGFLWNYFGYEKKNGYFYYNDKWGNLRGFSWSMTIDYFKSLPLLQKMFGVGPDCFSAYYQDIPEINESVSNFFSGLLLTNAHNEYLTKLINTGVIGLISYLSVFVIIMWEFLKGRMEQQVLGVFVLVAISYFVHNIFCYEQVCSTPIFFILLAFGNRLLPNKLEIGGILHNKK